MDKLPTAPSQYVALVGYDETSQGWYPIAIDPTTGAISQQQASSAIDSIAHGQISVGTGGALIVAARAGRTSVLIVNNGATTVYLGGQNVDTDDGVPLAADASVSIPGSAAIYGKTVSGTQTVSYLEVY